MELSLACIQIDRQSRAQEAGDSYSRNVSLSLEASPFLAVYFQGMPGIKGQIAAKMACDVLCEHASILWEDDLSVASLPKGMSRGSWIAREAFRAANNRVYRYAHVMGAGGQMGAKGFAVLFEDSRLIAVRVGRAQGYLVRGERIALLFEEGDSKDEAGKMLRFVGANAQILVDCAQTTLQVGDFILFSSSAINPSIVQEALGLQEFFSDRNDGSDVVSVLQSMEEAVNAPDPLYLVAMFVE